MATMIQAIRMALHVGESRLGVTDIFGEDVGPPLGGVFTGTQGLETAWNTPLDERGIVGTAIGLALAGRKPVAEIQFCDYAFNTIDLLKLAGGLCWSSNGDWNCPMVVMTPVGSGIHGSHQRYSHPALLPVAGVHITTTCHSYRCNLSHYSHYNQEHKKDRQQAWDFLVSNSIIHFTYKD